MNTFKPSRHTTHTANKPPINKEANFNLATDFPALSSSSSSSSNSSSAPTYATAPSTIDYSHTFVPNPTIAPAQPINLNPQEPVIPPPGWHKYSCNKSTHVITATYGKGVIKDASVANVDDEQHINEGQNFIKMMNRLEQTQLQHAEQFIECYGYDCYERTFLMPHYTPQNFSDCSDNNSNSNSDCDYYFSEDDL